METLLLGILVFSGVFLIISIRSIHCPYWQLPLGSSVLIGALLLTLVFSNSWADAALSWLGGVVVAVLAVCVRNYCAEEPAAREEAIGGPLVEGSAEKHDPPAT